VRRDGAVDRSACFARLRLQDVELLRSRVERRSFLDEGVERPAVFLDAVAIDAAQRGRGAVRASQLAEIIDVEQHAPVPRASHLVDVHEARFEIRLLAIRVRLKGGRAGVRGRDLLAYRRRVALDRGELLRLDLLIDFELAQLDDQRLLLVRQRLGFLLERREALGGALRQRLCLCSVGGLRLGAERSRERDHADDRRATKVARYVVARYG